MLVALAPIFQRSGVVCWWLFLLSGDDGTSIDATEDILHRIRPSVVVASDELSPSAVRCMERVAIGADGERREVVCVVGHLCGFGSLRRKRESLKKKFR